MQQRVIMAGAGGFGRELMSWAEDCHAAGRLPAPAGFIDDRLPEELGSWTLPYLGGFADYRVQPTDLFLIGVGSPTTRRQMAESLRDRGARFATLIHPTAVLGRNARFGEGFILCPMSMRTADTVAGDFVITLSFSGAGHDTRIGDFVTISSHVDIMGEAAIGNEVFIGSGARIMPGVRIGDGARIGANALVMRNVRPNATLYAPPGKTLNLTRE